MWEPVIDFSIPGPIEQRRQNLETVAATLMRPVARQFDDLEAQHEVAWAYVNTMWETIKTLGGNVLMPLTTPAATPTDGDGHPLW
jgi:hypothetical protein